MNLNDGGQSRADSENMSVSDLQRRTAAEIARRKVLDAYKSVTIAKKTNETDISHLKNTPVNPRINSESWKQYHSAWQNYYQKYYSDYYGRAARDYVERERLKDARAREEEEEVLNSIWRDEKPSKKNEKIIEKIGSEHVIEQESETFGIELKKKIRKKATDNAKKSRRMRKFVPLFAGLAVVLTILFLQYNRLIFAPIMAYVSPGNVPASEIEAIDPTITATVSPDPRLIIPKINVDVPIRFGVPVSGVMSAMNNGVAHYQIAGASALPGELGNFVITGHSAGDIYSSNPYKYIFSGLERLEVKDLIYVNYNSTRYTYQITGKDVIEPTNVAALVKDTTKPLITLVTCTPLGTSRYRLLVTGEQISPSYENSEKEITIIDEPEEALPSNEPGFFEGIWNWLTGN